MRMTTAGLIDISAIRDALPVTRQLAYLNTGTAGPLPEPTTRAMAEAAAAEMTRGRIGMAGFQEFFEDLADLRRRLAAFVGAAEGEVGLSHNTSEGMNIGIWGLDWRPGDEVVTTTLEHPGGILPLYQLHRRLGVKVTFVDIGLGNHDRTLDALAKAIRPGVRLVALSHVAWSTGAVLPLKEISALAHDAGALVLVDGAQSVGAIRIDMHDLDVDAYAFPGQKWLCGPEGTGGFYVHADRLEGFQPTLTGFFGTDHDGYRVNDPASLGFAPGAQRYEVASVYRPGIKGLRSSVRWISEQGDVFAAVESLAAYCRDRVAEIPGVQVLTPSAKELSGLVSFRIEGVDPTKCVEYLSGQSVAIRSIPDNGALRISCGFYNTPEEIDRVIELIDDFRR